MQVIKRAFQHIKSLFSGPKVKTASYPDPSYSEPERAPKGMKRKPKNRGFDGTMSGPFRSINR